MIKKPSECEHNWKIYTVEDHEDVGTNTVLIKLDLICDKCGAGATTEAKIDYSEKIENIDLTWCEGYREKEWNALFTAYNNQFRLQGFSKEQAYEYAKNYADAHQYNNQNLKG